MTRSQQSLLREYGIKPVKRRGQNFLIDTNLARAIAQDSLDLGQDLLELGAGGGALTIHLLEKARRVVCVEVDRNLCALLRSEYGQRDDFELVEGDLAKLDWQTTLKLAGDKPVVAGNLPYVLTSKVLFAIADHRQVVSGAVFMVQKEVAERLVATCGSRDFGILAVIMGSIFDIRICRTVPSSVFWPRPDVESAVVQLVPRGFWPEQEYLQFVAVVKVLFQQRRKKLRTQLRSHFSLSAEDINQLAADLKIDVELRPEQLDRESWRRLAALLPRKEKP
ncbi:MAG: ribosomal RNA small subunit methyltransferase A [bacterium]|nr:ribosomal RNA small subunit methyltransferase A [bacterium]